MIQKTNARHSSTAVAPLHQTEGPEQWGQWSGRRHYSLEVAQHPLRARMCGFGDKDRRPLAPAAVAKMIVRREDNSIVDVDDIDVSFFLVTVDLWSADGKHEVNLVLHPSSSERYVPTHTSKPRRRGTSGAAPPQRAGHQSPTPTNSTVTPSQQPMRPAGDSQPGGVAPIVPSPAYGNSSYPFNNTSPPVSETLGFPYSPSPDTPPTWGYPQQGPPVERNPAFSPTVLPSIHSFGRRGSSQSSVGPGMTSVGETWHAGDSVRDEPDDSFRGWHPESTYSAVSETGPNAVYNSPPVDPTLRPSPHPSQPDTREPPWSSDGNSSRFSQESYPTAAPASQFDNTVYASASYAQHPSSYFHGSYLPNSSPPASSIPPLPRHSYTRTLVGPLSANACRLLDEHRKPGIFFLFQDLSVRTEGTFRLRLRLMNVGAPPAPESGAIRVHMDVSPVLAQTFTEPFVVYSAKRFPGVPDTTALSIAFGNQGQKLPLRNRHGSSNKPGRRRQRGDSDGSDDEGSDGM